MKRTTTTLNLNQFHERFDIGVDAKPFGQIVMIYANEKGRQAVNDLWPEVEWSTDPIFAASNPANWRFTHVRVIQLPPHLASTGIMPADAAPDALGFAVATALAGVADPKRIVHVVGEGGEIALQVYASPRENQRQRRQRATLMVIENIRPTTTVAGSA